MFTLLLIYKPGEPVHQLNETINYNEHFSFSNRQGRLGFGPFGKFKFQVLYIIFARRKFKVFIAKINRLQKIKFWNNRKQN